MRFLVITVNLLITLRFLLFSRRRQFKHRDRIVLQRHGEQGGDIRTVHQACSSETVGRKSPYITSNQICQLLVLVVSFPGIESSCSAKPLHLNHRIQGIRISVLKKPKQIRVRRVLIFPFIFSISFSIAGKLKIPHSGDGPL